MVKTVRFSCTNSSEIKPAVIFHVVMVIWAAGLAALFGAGAFSMFSGDPLAVAYIVGAVLALLSWLSAVSLLKHVFLLVRRPQLRLSPDGILCAITSPAFARSFFPVSGWRSGGLPGPISAAAARRAPLLNLAVPIYKSLVIESTGPRIEFGWMTFRPGVETLQKEILDYLQLAVQKPARESARVAEFLSLLFRQPKTFPGPHIRRFEVVAAVAPSALCGLLLYLQFNKEEPNCERCDLRHGRHDGVCVCGGISAADPADARPAFHPAQCGGDCSGAGRAQCALDCRGAISCW